MGIGIVCEFKCTDKIWIICKISLQNKQPQNHEAVACTNFESHLRLKQEINTAKFMFKSKLEGTVTVYWN